MNRVTRRVWIMALFIAVLVGGTGFFVGEFMMKSDQWVISSGSPHVYNATNIGFGSVQDRNGIPLLDITENYKEKIHHAKELGYDAISSVAPIYYKYSFEEIKNYYVSIGLDAEISGFDS